MSNAYITRVLRVIGRSCALLLVGGAQLPGTSTGMPGGAAFTAATSSVTAGVAFCAYRMVDAQTRPTTASSLHMVDSRLLLKCYRFVTPHGAPVRLLRRERQTVAPGRLSTAGSRLSAGVPLEHLTAHDSAIYVAAGVNAHAFRP